MGPKLVLFEPAKPPFFLQTKPNSWFNMMMKSPVKVAVEIAARKKIIAANWKMNLTHREAKSYADLLWTEVGVVNEIEVVLIPPFTAIPALAEALEKSPVERLGAQNMHWEKRGPFPGEISATLWRGPELNHVVLGHRDQPRR